ncbi:hypothetical protein Droror1_Dr00002936 [Drosera rotundifolia]
MARSRSTTSNWRYVNPAYYLKRPKRLALLLIGFVNQFVDETIRISFPVRHVLINLLIDSQVEIGKLLKEVNRLQSELEEVKVGGKIRSPGRKDVTVNPIALEGREKVKEAMLHAWNSYEKYAWGQDELQVLLIYAVDIENWYSGIPLQKNDVNSFGGLGATLVDSLDTLYIMGLDEQFQRAREWIVNSLNFNKDYDVSVFETTIRVVGGLLSTYDLSNDKVFLEKTKDIADRLLPAWDTPSGIPYNIINLARGRPHNSGWISGQSILADSGTEQLEFIALSQRSGDPKYQQKVCTPAKNSPTLVLNKTFPTDGLLPIYINPESGTASHATITFGAMGDRYLLLLSDSCRDPNHSFMNICFKAWIQGNKTAAVKHYREMWETSMIGLQSLVRRTTPSSYAYLCEKNGDSFTDKDQAAFDEFFATMPWLALPFGDQRKQSLSRVFKVKRNTQVGSGFTYREVVLINKVILCSRLR